MIGNTFWIILEPDRLVPALEELTACRDDILLDFSSVARIDAAAVRALDALADRAEATGTKVTVRGVHVELHKVLKLLGLERRLTFSE